ncbi:MAG: Gfo/Idh/MocA family protein [Verrucomicrobiales bacterium]
MQKTTIRWGIIGCGDVTEKKSGPAFNKVPGSELVAVMRRDYAKAQDYARRHGVPHCFQDAEELIHHPDVDAVYVATPPGAHLEMALKVALAKKPCYVEKPMARNASECSAMVQAFESANTPLFVAYYRRALPHFERIASVIQDRSLGVLCQINYTFANDSLGFPKTEANWRFQPEISGGGLLWDLGSHALDLFDFWVGPLQKVSGHLGNVTGQGAMEELASLSAVASNGALISASWNFVSPRSIDLVALVFEHGVIHASVFGPADLSFMNSDGDRVEEQFELPAHIQQPLIHNVVDAVRGQQTALSTGVSGRRTNEVLDQFTRCF